MRRKVPVFGGFVLAGGQSSRFGSDKALAIRHGRSLLSHALQTLRDLGLDPWIVTPQPAAYCRYRARFVANEQPGRGPVEGVRVALHACATPWALILSVDMPGVTATSLRPLLERAAAGGGCAGADRAPRAFCFRDRSGRRHPFPGLYDRRLLEWIECSRTAGSMQELLERGEAGTLGPEDIPQRYDMKRVLENVNRPSDL